MTDPAIQKAEAALAEADAVSEAAAACQRAHLDLFGEEGGRKWIFVLEHLQKFAQLTNALAGENTIRWFETKSEEVWARQREIMAAVGKGPPL